MKELIYYPGFELQDETWLKFALLYLDELRPIIPDIPYGEDHYLSETARQVMHDTDLIHPYRPQYEESTCASAIACEEFARYLNNPQLHQPYFAHTSIRQLNLTERWRDEANHTCTLFWGKYTNAFIEFCIENGIATHCEQGIRLPQELAFVYMSFLADIISKNNEIEMFTDISKYNSLLLKNDLLMSRRYRAKLNVVKNNVELLIPNGLHNIPIEAIIDLRNQRSFAQSRKAYMDEVTKLIKAKESGDTFYSHKELLSRQSDFLGLCGKSFDMIASTTVLIATVLPLAEGRAGSFDTMSAVAASFNELRSVQSTIHEMPTFIAGLKGKRLARKYMAKINKLNNRWR